MVYLASLEEWQQQSALLLRARPTTAKISTKYNIPNLASAKYQKKLQHKSKQDGAVKKEEAEKAAPVPRGAITLKTYDPASGVVLKFKTDRAADVGRMIAGLGSLGRHMAALPEKVEAADTIMEDAAPAEKPSTASAPAVETKAQSQPSSNNAGGKKKKKGKK